MNSMKFGQFLSGRRPPSDHTNRRSGAVVGLVTDNNDPDGWGRVKVSLPWLSDDTTSHWCRIAQIYAGGGRGAFWLPEIGDEVAVVFDRGDMSHGFVLGGLWNGKDIVPPPGNQDGKNDYKIWRTRQSHQILFQDTESGEKITITDGPAERHLVIDVAENTITLTADPGDITFEAPEKSVTVSCKTLEVDVSRDSTWQTDTTSTDTCTDRTETITGADSVSAGKLWSMQTKSATIRPGTTTAKCNRLSAGVSSSLTISGDEKTIIAQEISRESAAETSTYGSLTIESTERAAFAGDGPVSLSGASTTIDTKDAVMSSGAVLTLNGGLLTVTGTTGVSALGGVVKIN